MPIAAAAITAMASHAQARGGQWLHKPIVAGKLRASVGEFITRRIAAAGGPVLVDASTKSM